MRVSSSLLTQYESSIVLDCPRSPARVARNTTLMHFTCYYFKHRCQPSTVNRRPQCQLLASLPPLLRGRLTHYLNPPTTDTTSDQQRLGTPPSRRPEVGNSLPSLPSLPPLSCLPYPANRATGAASSFVSWKMGRHIRARWRRASHSIRHASSGTRQSCA